MKKMALRAYIFQYYRLRNTWLMKCLKYPVSEHPAETCAETVLSCFFTL